MHKHVVPSHGPEGEEETDAPLLNANRNFTSDSVGSMELVGLRARKLGQVAEFEAAYRQPEERTTFPEAAKELFKKQISKFSCKRVVLNNFPIIKALGKYKITDDLSNDIISGLTSGIMMIPQGMAFASLSTLEPIVGLYISLFASITYFLLGTGQQLSWGCIAILSMMMGSILDKYDAKVKAELSTVTCSNAAMTTVLPSVVSNLTSTITSSVSSVSTDMSSLDLLSNTTLPTTVTTGLPEALSEERRLEVAGAVTLICGIVLAVLGKIGLGKATAFMSDSLITGFTVGVAFHVGSSQLKTIFGLGFLPRYSGLFKLLRLWWGILSNIHRSNLATVITSAICILIIYLVKQFVNEKYKKKLRVPVPIELIVVILATVITAFAKLNEQFSISIVKKVPVGVPSPRIPDMSLGADYITDGMVVIIVAFTQTVAMAKLMGLKHNYKVNPDQEMFACGVVSIVCAIFSGFISGASISRSVVQDSAGGRTQVASLIAACLVLLVIMLIGPYFYYLPKCVLSAIILVSLRSLFLKLLTIPDTWRKSQMDCFMWVVTCASVVILDADIGLFVGIITSVLIVLIRSQVASVDVTGPIHADDIQVWRSTSKYFGVENIDKTKVIRINSALYFANAEIVTNKIFKVLGANPIALKKKGAFAISDMVQVVEPEEKASAAAAKAAAADAVSSGDATRNTDRVNGASVQVVEPEEKASAATVNAAAADAVSSGDASRNTDRVNSVKQNEDEAVSDRDAVDKGAVPVSSTLEQEPNGATVVQVLDPDMSINFNKLILDLSGASFLDLMGVSTLEFLISKYDSVGIKVYLSNVHEKCLDTLQKSGFMKKYSDRVFLNTEAAIAHKANSEAVVTTL